MLRSLTVCMAGLHWGNHPCRWGVLTFPNDKWQLKCTLKYKMREKLYQSTQARHVISFTHSWRFFFYYVTISIMKSSKWSASFLISSYFQVSLSWVGFCQPYIVEMLHFLVPAGWPWQWWLCWHFFFIPTVMLWLCVKHCICRVHNWNNVAVRKLL